MKKFRPVFRLWWLMGALAAFSGCSSGAASGGAGGEGGAGSASGSSGEFVHGCFSSEALCDGKCVRVDDNPMHCGACNNACATGSDGPGKCADGKCVYTCNGVVVDDPTNCKNFFGAHESYPAECAGCSTPNLATGGCSCPSPSSELALAVQSDCPGVPMRSATTLRLCTTNSLSASSDFGGAYQVDDIPNLCGANAQCRVGNPLAGGGCACPAGFEPIALRSIIRLPCDNGETGSTIVLCGNKNVPLQTFGGAFQVDDAEPFCRVANPWTGGCSCPANTTERVYRVMVDGPGGLYGSTLRMCLP